MEESDPLYQLVARLKQGEPTASTRRLAERVFLRAAPVAAVTCRREARGVPPPRVEELVQQTLEVVWRRMEDFDQEHATFEAWVRGIAKNLCRNEVRKKRDLLTTDGVLEATDPAHPVLRVLLRSQREAILRAAIEASLEGIEQDVVYHRYVHGLAREKIAEILKLKDADEVRKILARSVRKLRKELNDRMQAFGHGLSLMRSDDGDAPKN